MRAFRLSARIKGWEDKWIHKTATEGRINDLVITQRGGDPITIEVIVEDVIPLGTPEIEWRNPE